MTDWLEGATHDVGISRHVLDRIRAAHEAEVERVKADYAGHRRFVLGVSCDSPDYPAFKRAAELNARLQERVGRLENLASALLIVARERNPRRLSEEDYEAWSHAVVNDAEQFLQPDAADKEVGGER